MGLANEVMVIPAGGIVNNGEPPDQIVEGDLELGAVQMTSRV